MLFTSQCQPFSDHILRSALSQRRFILLATTFFVFSIVFVPLNAGSVSGQTISDLPAGLGGVKGIIYNIDEQNVVAKLLTVVAERRGKLNTAKVNDDGTFTMTLTPGIYSIYL